MSETPIIVQGAAVGTVRRAGRGAWVARDASGRMIATRPTKIDAEAAVLARHHAPKAPQAAAGAWPTSSQPKGTCRLS